MPALSYATKPCYPPRFVRLFAAFCFAGSLPLSSSTPLLFADFCLGLGGSILLHHAHMCACSLSLPSSSCRMRVKWFAGMLPPNPLLTSADNTGLCVAQALCLHPLNPNHDLSLRL